VGVAAEEQFEISVRRLAINLRSVRKQDGKFVLWDSGRRVLYVVGPVIVGVIDSGEMNPLTVKGDRFGFVEQHPYSHLLQTGNHLDCVVIAQNAVHRLL
jgi:hypothetical protein